MGLESNGIGIKKIRRAYSTDTVHLYNSNLTFPNFAAIDVVVADVGDAPVKPAHGGRAVVRGDDRPCWVHHFPDQN